MRVVAHENFAAYIGYKDNSAIPVEKQLIRALEIRGELNATLTILGK
jgi:hypothetical protein